VPELPEVEIIARGLDAALAGQTIRAVEVFWERSVAMPAAAEFAARLAGQRIVGVGRRGKFVVVRLQGGDVLMAHLRMTGTLCIAPAERPLNPYVRVLFRLNSSHDLRFADTRKFGRLYLAETIEQVIGDLGPEPLGDEFTPAWLAGALRRRGARLKPLLLDQSFVAGLGNIYVDEALFRAGLHPLRRADSVSEEEAGRLHAAIQEVLRAAIGRRGTTLSDYRDAAGEPGENQMFLRVYHRHGQPCLRCGRPIERIIVGQRGTHFCPHCQPASLVGPPVEG
jgi:formamidopyrimidine-DNA glycosylase